MSTHRAWAAEDVPPPPYFHGTRYRYAVGDRLMTDVVSTMEGEEDDRQMCFATTSPEHALQWAFNRGLRHGGTALYVFEVEMVEPQVDVNMHRPGAYEELSCVMSEVGIVVRRVNQMPESAYTPPSS